MADIVRFRRMKDEEGEVCLAKTDKAACIMSELICNRGQGTASQAFSCLL